MLPLIMALKGASASERKHVRSIMNSKQSDNIKITQIVTFIKSKGGIQSAYQKMNELRDQAFDVLNSIKSNSPYKENLRDLVNFVIDRTV